jgi:Carboxypeptidase regulatory-like domain
MKTAVVALVLLLCSPASFASQDKGKDQKDEDLGPVALLNFVVLKDSNGKPVRNAVVVLHLVSDSGKQEKGGLELKTDSEGRADYDGMPYGKIRVQVLATGFQTFGADYDVSKPTLDISIKLKRPEGQYSVYEHSTDKPDSNPKPPQR